VTLQIGANYRHEIKRQAGASVVRPLDYVVVLICLVLVPSAVVHGLLGLEAKTVFAILAPFVLGGTLITNGASLQKSVPAILALTTIGAMASLIADSNSQLFMGATMSVATIAGLQLVRTLNKPKILRVVTWFTLLLLVGGILGLVYSVFGGRPLLEVKVVYRMSELYLTTFALASFAQVGALIRPSGIFDEPGAFAMYVAIITMFNDTLQQNRRLNLALIGMLAFTGSLAGMFIVVLYFLTSNSARAYRKEVLALAAVLAGASFFLLQAYPSNPLTGAIDTFYSERLQVADGRLVGDNRSHQISDFFALVNDEILIQGTKKAPPNEFHDVDETSNPFSITFGYGLIISLPYFALLLWLALMTIRNRFHNSYTSLGLLLLLLQRPYIYNLSWSILILSAVWLLYLSSHSRLAKGGAERNASRTLRHAIG
jgi:hypothetical protein